MTTAGPADGPDRAVPGPAPGSRRRAALEPCPPAAPGARVVGLGARCDAVAPEEATASPGTASFDVEEFADLSDGSRVVLHAERGFGVSGGVGQDPWEHLTAASVEAGVRTTVLPDDDDGEEHPWAWLAELLLRRAGVRATVAQLRSLPYLVELGPSVLERLAHEAEVPRGPTAAQ